MIPDSIKKEHVLKALEEAESQGIPKGRQSHRNYVEYNAKRYPPTRTEASNPTGPTKLEFNYMT